MMAKIKTIILFANYTNTLSYYDDWLDAFKTEEKFDLTLVDTNNSKNKTANIYQQIEYSPFIILHHSLLADNLEFIKPFLSALCARQGKLLAFVGNEVNLPAIQMKEKIVILKKLAPEYIATQLLQEAGEWLYSDCNQSKVVSLPHALNTSIFKPSRPFQNRTIDIGCRTARYGVYLGDNDRVRIIQFFEREAKSKNLSLDVAMQSEKRFTRSEWASFLNNCKATISTEAGTFYLEKEDQLINEILKYFRAQGNMISLPQETSKFVKLYRFLMPKFLRKLVRKGINPMLLNDDCLGDNTKFDIIWEKFFKNRPKAPVYTKCISSRHFDAIGTKTAQILFPGRFNDILKPNIHYLALNPDFSNNEEIFADLSNTKKMNQIIEEAYHHVIQQHTYSHRIAKIKVLL